MAEQENPFPLEVRNLFVLNTSTGGDTFESYLVQLPKRDPLSSVIPITVLYIVIFFTGMIGNLCTCVVIVHRKYMHTSTNCYLFSLAVSDLLLLVIGVPQEIYQLWIRYPYAFGEAFCVFRGLASETSTNASILTIMCFTIERYLAVSQPLRSQMTSSVSRAIKAIVMVWIVGTLSAAPLAFQFGVVKRNYDGLILEGSDECIIKRSLPHAFEISTFFFFVLPICAISVLYALISVKLFKTDGTLSNGESKIFRTTDESNVIFLMSRDSTRSNITGYKGNSSRTTAVKILFAVVVAFFVCWAPFHAQRLMALHLGQNSTESEVAAYNVLTHVSGVTYFVSATINPILYSIMSVKFRKAFRETLPSWVTFFVAKMPFSRVLCCCCGCEQQERRFVRRTMNDTRTRANLRGT